jgi:23S rRNA pseudouridine955/2504/2580 synthase
MRVFIKQGTIMAGVKNIRVKEEDAGIRLDRWFRRHFPNVSQGQLQKLLRSKQVKVDGARAEASQRLHTGQEIRVPPIKTEEKKRGQISKRRDERMVKDILEAIIYQDKDIIAINKPSGLAAQGGSKVQESVDSLLGALRLDEEENPKLVHRLDKDTSGVLLLARRTSVAAKLTEAFRNKDVKKCYWALVAGVPSLKRGTIELPLGTRGGPGNEKVIIDEEGGQSAITHYEVLETAGKTLSWVALYPVTGRKHQLRVHMSAIGHPIIGDGKYGGAEAFINGVEGRLHLHAREVVIPNFNGRNVEITADLPPHIEESFTFFGFVW